jgi:hypothetical protein
MITNTTIQSIGSLYHQFQIECILQEDPFELYRLLREKIAKSNNEKMVPRPNASVA